MTQEELDKKAAELFKLIQKTEDEADPRYKAEGQLVRAIAMIAVEFVADQKRIVDQTKGISMALTAIVDLLAAGYQNGYLVKIANEIELNTKGLNEDIIKGVQEVFGGEEKDTGDSSEEGDKAT